MNYPTNAIINTVPAANQLRKVSGFDPLKFLRRTTSERTGEKVLKLDLPYKQLWFRLACPNGRMVVKPLRVTDQLAIFEAMVYAAKDDTEPLARFTSTAWTAIGHRSSLWMALVRNRGSGFGRLSNAAGIPRLSDTSSLWTSP